LYLYFVAEENMITRQKCRWTWTGRLQKYGPLCLW